MLDLQSWRLLSSLPVPVGPALECGRMRVPDEAADKDFGCLLAQDRNPLTRTPVAQESLKASVILPGVRGLALPKAAFVAVAALAARAREAGPAAVA